MLAYFLDRKKKENKWEKEKERNKLDLAPNPSKKADMFGPIGQTHTPSLFSLFFREWTTCCLLIFFLKKKKEKQMTYLPTAQFPTTLGYQKLVEKSGFDF
jgi:hypothetical protein